jgi:hypothetical protein
MIDRVAQARGPRPVTPVQRIEAKRWQDVQQPSRMRFRHRHFGSEPASSPDTSGRGADGSAPGLGPGGRGFESRRPDGQTRARSPRRRRGSPSGGVSNIILTEGLIPLCPTQHAQAAAFTVDQLRQVKNNAQDSPACDPIGDVRTQTVKLSGGPVADTFTPLRAGTARAEITRQRAVIRERLQSAATSAADPSSAKAQQACRLARGRCRFR